jgi:hypothetical protein
MAMSRIGFAGYLKKTLDFWQNLENKGPEFFLPPRSLVLKVVTGKILETLKLCCMPPPAIPFWNRGRDLGKPLSLRHDGRGSATETDRELPPISDCQRPVVIL